jgi:hypothetical protein
MMFVLFNNNTTGVTSGTGTANPSEVPGVMIIVIASSAVDGGFDHRSGQTKD